MDLTKNGHLEKNQLKRGGKNKKMGLESELLFVTYVIGCIKNF